MNNIKLPCGLDKDGKIITIENAVKGLACGCFCPGCKQPLEAKKGTERVHHFAHKSKAYDCEHGYQSALHYLAKELFEKIEYLTFIKNNTPVKYKIDSVEVEHKLDEIIPDILVTCDGKKFIVEIYVTHAVDEIKKQKIKDMRISAVEIDLSRFHKEMISTEELKTELQNSENISWYYDSDIDFINEKKQLIEQYGLKIPFQIGNGIGCPHLSKHENPFARFVTLDFCIRCPNCVWNGKSKFISCGLPLTINEETRRFIFADVFVNDNKVLFHSELQEFQKSFLKKLERAMQAQYFTFVDLGRMLYASEVSYTATANRDYNKRGTYNRSYYHRRKR